MEERDSSIRVFISRDTGNAVARRLFMRLRQFRDIVPWLDEVALKAGDFVFGPINDAIEDSDVILVLLTPSYLASAHCRSELSKAVDLLRREGRRVIPVLVADCRVPIEVAGLRVADFRTAVADDGSVQDRELTRCVRQLVEAIRDGQERQRYS